jgi:hypothetical protein
MDERNPKAPIRAQGTDVRKNPELKERLAQGRKQEQRHARAEQKTRGVIRTPAPDRSR